MCSLIRASLVRYLSKQFQLCFFVCAHYINFLLFLMMPYAWTWWNSCFFIIFANLNSRKIRFLLVSIEMRKISWFLTKAEKIFERIPAKGNICFLLSNFLHFNFMTNQHLFTDQFFYQKKERWDRRKKINE